MPGVVNLNKLEELTTPRQHPADAAESDVEEQQPEVRARSLTDAEVWASWVDSYPSLASIAEHWQRCKASLGLGASGPSGANGRRDYSSLLEDECGTHRLRTAIGVGRALASRFPTRTRRRVLYAYRAAAMPTQSQLGADFRVPLSTTLDPYCSLPTV
jgi:hypothetical protein